MNTINNWKTPTIDSFNVRFTLDDLDYFRIRPNGDIRLFSKIRRVKHDKALYALNGNGGNVLHFVTWGGMPIWWKESEQFNGLPIYFIRTNKLDAKQYVDSQFYLLPMKCIIQRIASDFKVRWASDRQFWCIGIGFSTQDGVGVAFLQKPNQTLITIPEQKIRTHYRSSYADLHFPLLIREELGRFISREVLDRIVKVKEIYYD